MTGRRVMLGCALVLLAAAVGFALANREPSARGRKAGEWVASLSPSPQAGDEAVVAFSELGVAGQKFLIRQLQYRRPFLRDFLQRHATHIPVWLQPKLLGPPPPDLRYRSLQVLSLLGTNAQPVVPQLLAYARREIEEVDLAPSAGGGQRPAVVTNLFVQANSRGALQTNRIVTFASSSTGRMLPYVANALQMIGGNDPEIVRILLRAAQGTGSGVPLYTFSDDAVRLPVPMASAALRAIPIIEAGMHSPDEAVRRKAITLLATTVPQSGQSLTSLIESLDDKAPTVRLHTLRTLGALGPQARDAARAIRVFTQPADELHRYYAAQALWLTSGEIEPYLSILAQNLTSGGEQGPWANLKLIGKMGADAAPRADAVAALLDHPSDRIRGRAAITLGEIGPGARAAIPQLRRALRDEYFHVRDAATNALQRIEAASP